MYYTYVLYMYEDLISRDMAFVFPCIFGVVGICVRPEVPLRRVALHPAAVGFIGSRGAVSCWVKCGFHWFIVPSKRLKGVPKKCWFIREKPY